MEKTQGKTNHKRKKSKSFQSILVLKFQNLIKVDINMIEGLQLCQLLNLKYQQVKAYYMEFMAKLFPFSQITIWNCRWNIWWCSWNTWIHIATTRGFGTSRVSLGSVPMVSSIKSRLLKREFMFLSNHTLGKQD